MIAALKEAILADTALSRDDAAALVSLNGAGILELFSAASSVRERFRGNRIDLCSVINAKSGACSEDCSYCSQSRISRADIPSYSLVGKAEVMAKAHSAREAGVKRFCVVTSGRKVSQEELREIASMVRAMREIGLLPCATLGLLDRDALSLLRDSGLERYHHNLETSEAFFPRVCTSHTYQEKLKTIDAVKSVGLSLCSGGIFGLGESWQDRIEMAFALRDLGADSVPINFLIAIKGTPLGEREPLPPLEALKIVSLYRLMLPRKEIRICGGRRQILGEFNAMIFMAGADSVLTGNYLTTSGTPYDDDLKLIRQYGLAVG